MRYSPAVVAATFIFGLTSQAMAFEGHLSSVQRFKADAAPSFRLLLTHGWKPSVVGGLESRTQVLGPLYFGGAGWGGSALDGSGSLGFGGALIGLRGKAQPWMSWQAQLLAGGGGAGVLGATGGGFALEPSAGIAFDVPFIYPSLQVGWLYIPGTSVGGLSIGLGFNLMVFEVEVQQR